MAIKSICDLIRLSILYDYCLGILEKFSNQPLRQKKQINPTEVPNIINQQRE